MNLVSMVRKQSFNRVSLLTLAARMYIHGVIIFGEFGHSSTIFSKSSIKPKTLLFAQLTEFHDDFLEHPALDPVDCIVSHF